MRMGIFLLDIIKYFIFSSKLEKIEIFILLKICIFVSVIALNINPEHFKRHISSHNSYNLAFSIIRNERKIY